MPEDMEARITALPEEITAAAQARTRLAIAVLTSFALTAFVNVWAAILSLAADL